MTVHGADAVDEVHAAGGRSLTVSLTDIVTPLARERARDLDIEIVIDPLNPVEPTLPTPEPARSSPVRPELAPRPPVPRVSPLRGAPPPPSSPSPALYRRGAPLPSAVRIDRLSPTVSATTGGGLGQVNRVVVVGAGNVGMVTAMRLAEADVIDEVVLVDNAGQRAAGIALDLTHSAPLLGFGTRVRGVRTLAEAGKAEYVVITAGKARTPGMSRSDLVDTNAAIVGTLAAQAAEVSPDAVLLVVTNPLDEMTQHAWQVSGLPTDRVIGMAGVLDSARFEALTAIAAGVHPRELNALALGSHGAEMVMPLSQASVAGRPITEVLAPTTVDPLVDRARNSGGEVVGLLESGSAFFAPGLSAAQMVLSMIRESGEILAATVAAHGRYGIDSGYVGLPVRLNRTGLAEIVELPLTADELAGLHRAAEQIQERVGGLANAGAR